jgi:hypothetical protein
MSIHAVDKRCPGAVELVHSGWVSAGSYSTYMVDVEPHFETDRGQHFTGSCGNRALREQNDNSVFCDELELFSWCNLVFKSWLIVDV